MLGRFGKHRSKAAGVTPQAGCNENVTIHKQRGGELEARETANEDGWFMAQKSQKHRQAGEAGGGGAV